MYIETNEKKKKRRQRKILNLEIQTVYTWTDITHFFFPYVAVYFS